MILPRCAAAITILLVYVKLCLSDGNAPALEYENVIDENGYHFKYKTLDSEREEKGSVEPGKTEEEGTLRVEGSYNFVAPDGKLYEVVYVSDENGFRPKVSSGGTTKTSTYVNTGSTGYASPALIASLAGGGLG